MAGNRNDAGEMIVAGSGQAYYAPTGTSLPTTATGAMSAQFIPLGYHTTDGASFSAQPEVFEAEVWQSKQPARRELTKQNLQVSFTLVQFNEINIPLAFGGGSVVTDGGSGYKYAFPSDTDSLNEFALVLDVLDGTRNFRFGFQRGNVTEQVETQFSRTAAAGLPITYSVLAPTAGGSPGSFFTDDTQFAAGS